MRSSAALLLLAALPAMAQAQRFDWLSRIEAELPAIEACVRDHPAAPVGVAALHADGAARHLLLRDASALVWSCVYADGRAKLALEPDPASDGHRRPIFWLARYGPPWAECWDAEAVRGSGGRLVGWTVVQNC